MPSRRRILLALAPAALALLAPAGCGGGDARTSAERTTTVTKTVTVPATATAPAPPAATDTTPASTPDPGASLSLQVAEQALGARAYTALSERDWRPDQPLKVLIGIARPVSDAEPRRELAFFFVGATFIGTDTSSPSAQLAVVAQGGQTVTLRYGLYRPSDSVDAPGGGGADVAYRWTGTRLVPQDPIPTDARDAPLSRR